MITFPVVTFLTPEKRPRDVADDSLIPEFDKLQKSRPKKENLPSLPDLPPPSSTNFLPEPPQPASVSIKF